MNSPSNERCTHRVTVSGEEVVPDGWELHYCPWCTIERLRHQLNDRRQHETPCNCRDAGPGRGLCDMCAQGHYEKCRYLPKATDERMPEGARSTKCEHCGWTFGTHAPDCSIRRVHLHVWQKAPDSELALCACGDYSDDWYCPRSPDRVCHYTNGSFDQCDYCGQPDERVQDLRNV